MRILGEAKVVDDRDTKAKVAGLVEWFNMFWKSVDDPGYTLLQIVPKKIVYSKPGDMQAHEFTL
jgi:general stress protein 26